MDRGVEAAHSVGWTTQREPEANTLSHDTTASCGSEPCTGSPTVLQERVRDGKAADGNGGAHVRLVSDSVR